jgi:hypothetical protein
MKNSKFPSRFQIYQQKEFALKSKLKMSAGLERKVLELELKTFQEKEGGEWAKLNKGVKNNTRATKSRRFKAL